MITKYAEWVVKYKVWVLLAGLAIMAITGYGAKNLTFVSNYRAFFSEGNPQLAAYDRMQATYGKHDFVLFVLVPKSGDAFDPDTLKAVYDLTDAAWQLPYSTRVDSIANYQHTEATEDELMVDDLMAGYPDLTAADRARIKAIATSETLLKHRLTSPSGDVTAVKATLHLPEKNPTEAPEAATAARELAATIRAAHPDIDVHITGPIMLSNAFFESAQTDSKVLIPIMFAVITIVLGFMLRSFTGTLASLVIIGASIVVAMGLFGWGGWFLSAPSAAAPTIIVTIAVADCVHLLVSFLQAMRNGQDKASAMINSLRINAQPIFITSLTTVIGFLSMNTSDVPLFGDLGTLTAFGVAAAWLFSMTVLPALIMILPVKVKPKASRSNALMERLADGVIAKRRPLFWSILIGSLGLSAMTFTNTINDEFIRYFDTSLTFRSDTDRVEEKLTGIYSIDYSLHSALDGGIANPQFLEDTERFAQWLRSQPEVQHVSSITDIYKRLNRNMHGDDPQWYRLPESTELASQYMLLYEMSLPFGLDLGNQVTLDKSSTRLMINLHNVRSEHMLALEQRAANWLKEHTQISESYASSASIMFSHIGYRNAKSMVSGTLLAMGLITLILIVALRSVKLGLISMIPNMLPIGIAFGIWALINGDVGLSLATSVGMALGIVVDDTVHFLSKYLRAKREQNLSDADAVRYAFSTVGPALWVTSLVLIAGFVVLSLSTFSITADRGVVAAMTIALALFIDFVFLPTLLINRKTAPATPSPT